MAIFNQPFWQETSYFSQKFQKISPDLFYHHQDPLYVLFLRNGPFLYLFCIGVSILYVVPGNVNGNWRKISHVIMELFIKIWKA